MAQRNDFTKGIVNDAYDWYFERKDYAMLKSGWSEICDVRDVTNEDGAYEQSTSVIGSGTFTKFGERESIPEATPQEGFTTYAKYQKFGKKVPYSSEVVSDIPKSKSGNILKDEVMGWADDEQRTLELFYADHFNKGGFTAGDEIFNQSIVNALSYTPGNFIYDSKPWFALTGNDHTSKGGSSYFNSLGLGIDPANLEAAMIRLKVKNARNERDERVDLGMNYILLCAGELEPTCERIVLTEKLPSSDQNDTNVLYKKFRIVPSNYITTPTSWYVGVEKKMLRAYKKRNLKIDFYWDEDTETYWVTGSLRYGAMIQNFRFTVAGSTPTS